MTESNESNQTCNERHSSESELNSIARCGDCGEVIKYGEYGIAFCEDCMFNFQSQDLEDQLLGLYYETDKQESEGRADCYTGEA